MKRPADGPAYALRKAIEDDNSSSSPSEHNSQESSSHPIMAPKSSSPPSQEELHKSPPDNLVLAEKSLNNHPLMNFQTAIRTSLLSKGLMKIKDIDDPNAKTEDLLCCICLEPFSTEPDKIVICEICNILVHQTCYGDDLIPEVPEEDWLCQRCKHCSNTKIDPASIGCEFCPNKDGAFKQIGGKWYHVACINWMSEIYFLDEKKNQLSDLKKLKNKKNRFLCTYCKKSKGYTIMCDYKKCIKKFHVTCAMKEGCIVDTPNMLQFKRVTDPEDFIPVYCKEHFEAADKNPEIFKYSDIKDFSMKTINMRVKKPKPPQQSKQKKKNGKNKKEAKEAKDQGNSASRQSKRIQLKKQKMKRITNHSSISDTSNSEKVSSDYSESTAQVSKHRKNKRFAAKTVSNRTNRKKRSFSDFSSSSSASPIQHHKNQKMKSTKISTIDETTEEEDESQESEQSIIPKSSRGRSKHHKSNRVQIELSMTQFNQAKEATVKLIRSISKTTKCNLKIVNEN